MTQLPTIENYRGGPEITVSPNSTDRPTPVNNIFIFSYWDLKISGNFYFTLQPMCVEVGRVRLDEARDRFQIKTKHYNMIFSSVIAAERPKGASSNIIRI